MASVYANTVRKKLLKSLMILKDLGFHYATTIGLTMGMGDFEPIDGMDRRY